MAGSPYYVSWIQLPEYFAVFSFSCKYWIPRATGKTIIPINITKKDFERHSDRCIQQMYKRSRPFWENICFCHNCIFNHCFLFLFVFVVFFFFVAKVGYPRLKVPYRSLSSDHHLWLIWKGIWGKHILCHAINCFFSPNLPSKTHGLSCSYRSLLTC